MRSRPKIKLLLNPPNVMPGDTLLAEAVLSVLSETPVDFVRLRLEGNAFTAVGQGKQRVTYRGVFYDREWTSPPMKMFRGEMRFPTSFDLPAWLPPTYNGADASITYRLNVYVSIPWWPDRSVTFEVPVRLAPTPAPEPLPTTFASTRDGPKGKLPFMEVSYDATQLAIGDVLSGSVSLQNLHGRKVRSVGLTFVELETLAQPRYDVREGMRFRLRVFDGCPPEGVAIPFRVRLPDTATVTMGMAGRTQMVPLSIATQVEMRADVAWGEDIVLRSPIVVFPRASTPRPRQGWVAPVGRERQMLVWQNTAMKLGLINDEEGQRMTGQRGHVTVAITTEHRENDFWLVATLGWPNLGLDLDVAERTWSDALAVNVIKVNDPHIDERFAAHAREYAQAAGLVTSSVLGELMPFESVKITDEGAVLALRGAPHNPEKLEPFILKALSIADTWSRVIAAVPPPTLFAADVTAWEALASRLRGRLERGRMFIHDGQVGPYSVDIGSIWEGGGLHLGSVVSVAIDPPLETVPTTIEAPSLSPAARDAWRELANRSKSVAITKDAVTIELEGRLADPQTAMPVVDLAVALRRALTGTIAAGPFR